MPINADSNLLCQYITEDFASDVLFKEVRTNCLSAQCQNSTYIYYIFCKHSGKCFQDDVLYNKAKVKTDLLNVSSK